MIRQLISLCFFLVLCFYSTGLLAETKTLNQWINLYIQDGHSLFFSSDYLDKSTLNQPINIDTIDLANFRQALLLLNFKLEAVSSETDTAYVIKPVEKQPATTVLLHAIDIETDKKIKNFTVTNHDNETFNSENQHVLLNKFPDNNYQIFVTSSGYVTKEIQLDSATGKTKSISIKLQPSPLALSDIRVSTSLVSFNDQIYGQQTLTREDLNNQAALNHDPLRASERLAGTASNGINGKVHTRGGNLNESLVLLDNRELRNPYHFKDFFSLFSTINDSVVDSIDYYSGVFPAEYGGRLSSVVDVQSNQWADLPNHEANLGLLISSYTYRNQNPSNDRYYMMALRTGGQLIDKHLIEDVPINPEYEDGYFKASQIINDNWSMSQHLLVSRDEISIDQDEEMAKADYHDQNLWLQWQYDDLGSHQINFQAYASRRHDRRVGSLNDANTIATVNEDIESTFQGFKFKHQWGFSDRLVLDYGVDITAEETRILSLRDINHESELVNLLGLNTDTYRAFDFEAHGVSIKSHANARYQLNESWVFDLGVHYLNQEWVSGGDLSPRFNIAYFPSPFTSWHFGLGRHQQAQHIDELLLEDSEPQYFQPASADLAVFEFNHHFSNDWQFLSELYYKKYSQTHPYYENLFNGLHVLPDLFYDRIRLDPNDAKAAGIELTLRGKYKSLDWSTSYAYSDVKDQFDLNQIPRSWNQRNAFKFYLGLPIKKWRLNLNADFHSGWPITTITQLNENLALGERNQDSFKDFYQLSLKLDRSWQSRMGLWQFELQLTNALNINNTCCRDYTYEEGSLVFENKNGLPIIPNLRLGLSW